MFCMMCGNRNVVTLTTDNTGVFTKRVKQCRKCEFVFRTEEKMVLKNHPTQKEVKEYEAYLDEEFTKSKGQ